jgi:hypothetical protein
MKLLYKGQGKKIEIQIIKNKKPLGKDEKAL